MMKAVITDAGEATRMRPASYAYPKSLFTLYTTNGQGKQVVAPAIHLMLEQLFDVGAKSVCIVVGENGDVVRRYVSKQFPGMEIGFVTQEKPIGFGDAVQRAERFIGKSPFILNVGDIVLLKSYEEAVALFNRQRADAVLLIRRVDDPERYGIVTVEDAGMFFGHRIFQIEGAEEKPKKPKSNYAIVGVYVFRPTIFGLLREEKKRGGEVELTPAIQRMIADGGRVYGLLIDSQFRLNVGDTESYHDAFNSSYMRR